MTNKERNAMKYLYKDESNMSWIYPFVQNDSFLHFIKNAVERHRDVGKHSFWISNNSDCYTITKN